jgi:hypothetical protein
MESGGAAMLGSFPEGRRGAAKPLIGVVFSEESAKG